MQATFYAHFVDFGKVFDSVHHKGLWRIMKTYGIPDKLIIMVKIMYDDFECSLLEEGEQTRWFKITTVVKQGCVMSGFLFLLTMRRTTESHGNGIRWNFTSMLEDLDFADDVFLVSSKYEHIQNSTFLISQNFSNFTKVNISKLQFDREFEGHEFVSRMTSMCYPRKNKVDFIYFSDYKDQPTSR